MSSDLRAAPSTAQRPVWIDTDLALGAWRGDVDDGYALAAVLAAPGVQLLGISTVSGNAPADVAYRCATAPLQAAGQSHRVLQGASRPGKTAPRLRPSLRCRPGAAVLALGPLSNVAAALRRDPT